jgi:serine protease Do
MKQRFYLINLVFFTLFIAAYSCLARAHLPAEVNNKSVPSLAPMLQKVLPAVVNIAVTGEVPAGQNLAQAGEQDDESSNAKPKRRGPNDAIAPNKFESLGSGVIFNAEKGYIVTNAHVLRDAKTITVNLKDGRQLPAKVIGSDPASDVAVLQIQADKLTAIALANSDELQVGDFVVAIGNPFGLSETVTSGIISALQRNNLRILGVAGYENFIQTDAPINPGSSGGALVNLKGELVGVNTAILSPEGGNIGIGFAIPTNMVKGVQEQLVQYGSVSRGLMGVMIQNLTPELTQALGLASNLTGAVVTSVNPNSPAQKAGFKPGDVIQKINDKPIKNAGEVTNTVAMLRVGSKVDMQLLRGKKQMAVTVTTESPKDYEKGIAEANPFLYGLNLRDFQQMTAIFGPIQGVQVISVPEESPAYRGVPVGLRPGDVIVSANQQTIHNVQDLDRLAKNSDKQLLLNILRGNGSMFVVVK